MLQPGVRRTWAPRGQTPIHHSWDRHDRLSVISAITIAPQRRRLGLHFDIHTHNITTDEVYRFVQSLRRRLRRGIILVWDRWNVHRAAARRLSESRGPAVGMEWLPAYAPELNPTEQVWNHAKYTDLANFLPNDAAHLADELFGSLLTMRSDRLLLRSFIHAAKLKL
jgi:transposase